MSKLIVPNELAFRYADQYENPELFFDNISFRIIVDRGNDLDYEYSDWTINNGQFVDQYDIDE